METLEDVFSALDNASSKAEFTSVLEAAASNACDDHENIDAHIEIYMCMYKERCADNEAAMAMDLHKV